MLRTANRVLLGLIGLVLVALGGSVLAVGLGARPPHWWIHDGPHDVLLSTAERTKWRDQGWWWPVVIAVLALLLLAAVWWLSSVLRRRRLAEVLVDTGDGEGALLRGRALEAVLTGEAQDLAGVRQARVLLGGRRSAPETRVWLLLEPHGAPAEALDGLAGQALAHARGSAGLARLPADVRLRAARHRAQRVS